MVPCNNINISPTRDYRWRGTDFVHLFGAPFHWSRAPVHTSRTDTHTHTHTDGRGHTKGWAGCVKCLLCPCSHNNKANNGQPTCVPQIPTHGPQRERHTHTHVHTAEKGAGMHMWPVRVCQLRPLKEGSARQNKKKRKTKDNRMMRVLQSWHRCCCCCLCAMRPGLEQNVDEPAWLCRSRGRCRVFYHGLVVNILPMPNKQLHYRECAPQKGMVRCKTFPLGRNSVPGRKYALNPNPWLKAGGLEDAEAMIPPWSGQQKKKAITSVW